MLDWGSGAGRITIQDDEIHVEAVSMHHMKVLREVVVELKRRAG